ncbi:MAG: BrnT family toxin [Candidatus Kapabacteria bacterium]|nr:BrnT family toxin [Candidatus Kapabacteria bacterium]
MSLKFEWDEDKAKSNLKKHGITFEEAISVLNDQFSLTIEDIEHSVTEQRFIDIGFSNKNRLLVVHYTERHDKIRIISSRLATKKEIKNYENN